MRDDFSRKICLVAAAVLAAAAAAAMAAMPVPPDPPPSPVPAIPIPDRAVRAPLGEALHTHLRRLEPFGFSGAVLAARGGEVLLHQAYGFADAGRKVPFTTDTAFDIGSITKQFTAAAILKLEMQRKLSVQDPVAKWLPGVPEDKQGITLHHLLTHSAGLADGFGGDYEEMPRDELVKAALGSKLLSPPGRRYSYSNAGYSLLGAVLEKASGRPYESYLRENLWLPAGMTRTGYLLQEKGPLSRGVRNGEDWGTPLDHAWAPDGPWWNLRANGGVLSTTADLYRWHLALQGEEILSGEAKAKMFTPHVPEDEEGSSHYGYGWAIFETPRKTRLIAHNGGNGIFAADFRRYVDEGVVLIAGSNRSDFSSIPVMLPLVRRTFGMEQELPPAVQRVDPAVTRRLAGTYVLPSGGRLRVEAAESPAGWPGVTVAPEGKDAFLLLAGGTEEAGHAEREQRLLDGLERSRKGEHGLLAEIFGRPAAEVAEQGRQVWTMLEGKHGAFRGLELLGTVRANGRPTTWIEVRHEKGSALMELGWGGPTVVVIRLHDNAPGGLFLPESEFSFVSYEPRSGAVMRIGFRPEKTDVPILAVSTPGGEVRARRVSGRPGEP